MMTTHPTAEQSVPRKTPTVQPRRQPGRFNLFNRFSRLPAKNQAMASALMLLPTVALYLPIARFGDASVLAFWASGPYFLAVLAVVARSRRRRRWALPIAAMTFITEAAVLLTVGDDRALIMILFVTPIAYVSAWGVARRREPRWWKVGLPLAAILVVLPLRAVSMAQWDAVGDVAALTFWLSWPGVVALGCLVCWIADIRARHGRAQAAGTEAKDIAQSSRREPLGE